MQQILVYIILGLAILFLLRKFIFKVKNKSKSEFGAGGSCDKCH